MQLLSRKFGKGLQWHHACCLGSGKSGFKVCYEAMLIKGFWRTLSAYGFCESQFGLINPCFWEEIDGSGCEPVAKVASRTQNTYVPIKKTHKGTKSWDMVSTEEVLAFIRHMQELASIEDFIHLLQKCRKDRVLVHVLGIHTHLCNNGLETNGVLGNMLVQLFLECKSLVDSNRVFNKLFYPDEHTWTALIQGYNEYGDFESALHLFTLMPLDHAGPSKYTYVAGLKACAGKKFAKLAQQIHMKVVQEDLDMDPFIINSLVGAYSKCGLLPEARKVFQSLLIPSVVSWTALMTGYAEYGVGEDVLQSLNQMLLEGMCPNAFTVACGLRTFANVGALERGQHMHSVIAVVNEFQNDLFVGNALVDMYAKCGKLDAALKAFNMLKARDVVTWTTLIAGFVDHGLGEKAADHLEEMQAQGVAMNAVTLSSSLKACATMGIPEKGRILHSKIVKKGFELDQVVGNALVDMYGKFGLLLEAQQAFEHLPWRTSISWNILIAGYSEQGLDKEALFVLRRFFLEGGCVDATSYISSLKACGNSEDLSMGCLLHCIIVQDGHDTDSFIGNSLVDMYAKCHASIEAINVFTHLPSRSVIAWTACISVYLDQGLVKEALIAFENMQVEGISPDEVAYVFGLQACGIIGALGRGRVLHSQIVKHGFESVLAVCNTLIHMYDKSHSLLDAYHLFVQLPSRTSASWSALIAGYAENDLCGEALMLLEQMEQEGLCPNAAAFASTLRACGTLGMADKGQELHAEIVEKGLTLEMSVESGEDAKRAASVVVIGNGLIDMYAKCKDLVSAQHVFDTMPKLSLETWNVLMVGYTRIGEDELVFNLFCRLKAERISMNGITFLSLLTACSHAGLIEKGERCYLSMSKEFGIGFTIDHHNCLIDLLGRAGQLSYAIKLLEEMPSQPNMSSWNTVLAACRKWGNVELARRALECAMRLDENHAAAFIAMYNIYANANMWTDAKRIKAVGKKAKAK
ncbi:hypothetical protein GOP47_0025169 [Adiantum capillus-veneris]|uniref:Pentatricopeptide repeat-containing protein n=1 Tax=Adiantum capillus-veneris TaxID=13818 RepID=A0A9D4U5C2_ADICA|nr:hypothetical protein GOP47_0025169 [Adiantum capillus-veneris]